VIRLLGGVRAEDIDNEMRAITKLCKSSHPNIIQVFQHGELYRNSTVFFIDMELCDFSLERYCRGMDVPQLVNWTTIREQGALPASIRAINDQIINALVFIHEHGEVHRDLCPQNGDLYS
jgi:serine/threonine protein kinase